MSGIYFADDRNIERAALVIKSGGLVAFPTETVYGLGANAYDARAVARIFEVKHRPNFNPLISHVVRIEDVLNIAVVDERALFLAEKFWPGPLTFVLPRKKNTSSLDLVCAGLDTITVRSPNHPVALKLIEKSGVPIAAPSANISQTLSPTSAVDVFNSLEDNVDMILDGGLGNDCHVGVESTIVDLTTKNAVILRAGGITKEDLEGALNESVSFSDGNPDKPKSPGQLLKHYAPSKPLRINVTDPYDDELFIAFGEGFEQAQMNLSPKGDLREAAAHLFSYLHEAQDNKNFDKIAMAPIPNIGVGVAINDRIFRASKK